MTKTVIKIENLSKLYQLGEVGTGTLVHDLNRWWQTKILQREDPYAKIGSINDRTAKAERGEYVWALKDINLEVKEGEVLGVIGMNGAGKSTLLKLLSRVTNPTTGSIKISGRLASLLEVGTGFHPELTGRENIYMNGTIMGMRKREIDAKLDEIVDFAGVEKYLDTPTKRYSSGMTVRLGFAIAAFLEPEILIVDEVLAVGDAEFQKRAIGKMQDISQGGGRTVLFVSHNMSSIESLCSRGIVLENGLLGFNGSVQSAMSNYLGNIKMSSKRNLIERIDRKGSRQVEFVDFGILNEVGNRIHIPISGKTVLFRLFYKNHSDIRIDNCRASIAIKREEIPLIILSSELVYQNSLQLERSGYIDFAIENFPLSKGTYYLTFFLESNSEILDWVDKAYELHVEDGDFYGLGKNYPTGWEGKTVLVNHSLSVK